MVHDQQPVQRAHRGQPVRHHQRAAAFHQALHGLLDQHLAFAVQAGRGLIQDQDGRVREEGARDRHALALAAGQLHAALAHHRVIALGQAHDEVVRAGLPRRVLDLGLRRAGPAVGDVLGQRAVEQDGLLLHDRDLTAQRGLLRLGDVLSVDQDAAFVDVVQALDQLDERGLARTRMAHQPDALARRDARREMLVQRRVVRAVAEGHVVEADLALGDADRARARLVGHAQGWRSSVTSSSMSLIERCRLRMSVPTSRR